MNTCGQCTQMETCFAAEGDPSCDDFDRGPVAVEETPRASEVDLMQLWSSVAFLRTEVRDLEGKVNRVLAAIVRAAND